MAAGQRQNDSQVLVRQRASRAVVEIGQHLLRIAARIRLQRVELMPEEIVEFRGCLQLMAASQHVRQPFGEHQVAQTVAVAVAAQAIELLQHRQGAILERHVEIIQHKDHLVLLFLAHDAQAVTQALQRALFFGKGNGRTVHGRR